MSSCSHKKPTKSSHAFDLLCCRLGIERWRRVVHKGIVYPDHDVSNFGRIRRWRRPREKVLSQTKRAQYQRARKAPFLGSYGEPTFGSKANGEIYMRCQICNSEKRHNNHLVHRLVAEAFIPNDENKPTVDHWKPDDANKTNNRLDNLRWATRKEQAGNQRPRTRESYDKLRRPVWKLDKTTGERLERYNSVGEACQAVDGKSPGKITNVCNGKYQTMYGFKWAYDDEDVNAREDETWKRIEPDVLDTMHTYDCSTYGRVRRVFKPGETKIIEGTKQPRGLVIFYFTLKNGQRRAIVNNVLTARMFIPNPDNLPEVNHIDGDPSNSHVGNLEWITRSGNMQHAYANGLRKHAGWTRDEDNYIRDIIARYPEAKVGNGGIPWVKEKLILPGRTMRAMSKRANMLRKTEANRK